MNQHSKSTKNQVHLAAAVKHGKPDFSCPSDLRYHQAEPDVFTRVAYESLFHRNLMPDVMQRVWTGGSFRSTGVFQMLFYDGFSFSSLEAAFGPELYDVTLTRMLHEIETRTCVHDPVALVRGIGFRGAMPFSSLRGLRPHSIILDKPKLGSYYYDAFKTNVRAGSFDANERIVMADSAFTYHGCILVYERKQLYDMLRADVHRCVSRSSRKAGLRAEVQYV